MQLQDNIQLPIKLLFHIGFITLLPLISYTQFQMLGQIIQYYNYGYYHIDCLTAYMPWFTRYDFDICKSTDIVSLLIGFSITVSLFFGMARFVYIYITKELLRNNKKK